MHDTISPSIIGLYWLAASFTAATLWTFTARRLKRAGHRAAARCYCGTCS